MKRLWLALILASAGGCMEMDEFYLDPYGPEWGMPAQPSCGAPAMGPTVAAFPSAGATSAAAPAVPAQPQTREPDLSTGR